ncbi:protein phosphatase, putative [Plasmodium gallinaceum]|uniref:Protein phosphatase n=1 Tax=Plasmodium gallinaceum TaxID=5849 RepID=A0A1J1GNW9_PLAGA|nr:protein phosphatase, putative [Plasmodium gallinaceum]CRG94154.1 protein phosphatase, putative [Plasmodium gallinaceum]
MIFIFLFFLIIFLSNMSTYKKETSYNVYSIVADKFKRKMSYLLKKDDYYFYRYNFNTFSKELEKQLKKKSKTKNELGMLNNVLDKLSFLHSQNKNKNYNKKCDKKFNKCSNELKVVVKPPHLFLKKNLPFNFFNFANLIYIKHKLKRNILFSLNKKSYSSINKHSFSTNYKIIKHPDKKESEDCCLNGQDFMAIADGVGSWIKYGINPRKYPEKFLQLLHKKINENINMKIEDALNYAYLNTDIEGSATICLIIFNNNNTVSTAVIGDSQFMIIRNNNIIYKSKPQQYEFNFPYQLGSNSLSKPKDAEIAHIEVQKNDIIVAGTDGLWDNLYDNQILNIVKKNEFSMLSEKIANEAFNYSKMKRWMSPYIKNYNKIFNCHKTGGKMDDITVSCALVC